MYSKDSLRRSPSRKRTPVRRPQPPPDRRQNQAEWIDPPRSRQYAITFCHFCGYTPLEPPPDGVCIKCGKAGWERAIVSERLLPLEE